MRHMLSAAILAASTPIAVAATGETVRVTGEAIDTWCYFSGVMGGPEAVVGSAHHACALWCAAGGIPVGLRADDGTVYMVLAFEGREVVAGDAMLEVQSDRLVVDGLLHERDGVKYLLVERVVDNMGVANRTHVDFGVVPGFAIPEPQP